jgi:hypothetical protein
MDRSHTKERRRGNTKTRPTVEPFKEAVREKDQRLAGEDWSSKKRVEAGMSYGSWQLIDRSGESS